METSAQSPFQKLSFGSSSQKARKSRYQTFLVLSSFTGFLSFVPNILPSIVDKSCFQHDLAFEELSKRRTSYKVLRDKAFNIAKNLKYNPNKRVLPSMVYKFFSEKTSGGVAKSEIMPNQNLVEELHKSVSRKFEKRKVRLSFYR